MLVPVLLGLFVCALVVGFLHSHAAARRISTRTWESLLLSIEPISRDAVANVAAPYLNPSANQLGAEPQDMWISLGGMAGLARMRKNADVLIALAAFAERWNTTEGIIVVERMRRDAELLKKAVFQIRLQSLPGMRGLRIPFYLHEAAAGYYLMTQRLLALYETSHSGLLPRLAQAV